ESYFERMNKTDRPLLLIVRLPSAAVCQQIAGQTSRTAVLSAWDEYVGGLSQVLDDHNLRRRVCVMFTSLSAPETGTKEPADVLSDKHLRVPLIVSWAGSVTR